MSASQPADDGFAAWSARHPAVGSLTEQATDAGIPVRPVYTAADVAPGADERNGWPGEPPFARGIYPTMYRGKLWTMRMYSGLDAPEETNKRFRFLLEQGQTGLSVALDLPTQMGYDSDDPAVRHEVGRTGVAVCTVDDMAAIFDGIPLAEISTSFTINATAPIILAFYIVAAERQGVPLAKVAGTIQNDILKEYISRNAYIFPPEPALRFVADAMEFCAQNMPAFHPVSVCGYHMRQAGCDAVQEVAFTIANGLVYCDALIERGLCIDDFAPRFSFNFSVMSELFEEVAKLRAARRIWSRLIGERYEPRNPRSQMLRLFSGGDGTSLTSVEPLNNIVRVTMHQLGVVLGGAQAVHTVSYDEAIGLPTEEAAMVALRTQQILAHETGITKTVDPLAGSYYVESLTDEIDQRASALIAEVESRGGMPRLISSGQVQFDIDEKAFQRELAIAKGQRKIVGVNCYRQDDMVHSVRVSQPNAQMQRRQIERVREHRCRRDEPEVRRRLSRVAAAAAGTVNTMEPILDAVRSGATIGELSDSLRTVWGTFAAPAA
jgi:methylmalonyl-CoA mutase, N-terminal domain